MSEPSGPECLFRVLSEGDGHRIYKEPTVVSMPDDVALAGAYESAGIAIGRPCAFSESATSSLSMRSLVVRASSSTSADVRPFVGMGSRTKKPVESALTKRKKKVIVNQKLWSVKDPHWCKSYL
jgi:hypothetical protein